MDNQKKMNALVINCSPVKNGATAEMAKIAAEELQKRHFVKSVCVDDYKIEFCRGCRRCHQTAKCENFKDDFLALEKEFESADIVVCCAPSYWADVPGQFKAFIDRWTPWCNTHEPHANLPSGKKGYSLVLRTGPNMKECERLIYTIEHFYGHLEIEAAGRLGFVQVENKADLQKHRGEIAVFCEKI